jgi:hypothetical protein
MNRSMVFVLKRFKKDFFNTNTSESDFQNLFCTMSESLIPWLQPTPMSYDFMKVIDSTL